MTTKNPPTPLNKMTNEELQAIVDLTEARILKISKDDLRMNEEQLLWSPELESEVVSYWKALNDYWKTKKLPKCTCADQEGGFMALEKWNGYYFNGQPCSIDWYRQWKESHDIQPSASTN